MRILLPLFMAAALLAHPALQAQPTDISGLVGVDTFAVAKAEFGVFNRPDSGKPTFQPAIEVPYGVGQGYGWVFAVKTKLQAVRVREEFTLPAAPARWGPVPPGARRSISSDGRTATTERLMRVQDGLVFNATSVLPGDPRGHHVMRVKIETADPETFEFDLR